MALKKALVCGLFLPQESEETRPGEVSQTIMVPLGAPLSNQRYIHVLIGLGQSALQTCPRFHPVICNKLLTIKQLRRY